MSEIIRRYTAAFMFVDTTPRRVYLVRKNRPAWQDGLLNGIGGEIERGETPGQCVTREFYEETGFNFEGWSPFCAESGPGYEVFFYRMMFHQRILFDSLGFPDHKLNDSGEELGWHDVPLKEPGIGNLNWLIPMALDPRAIAASVASTDDIRRIMTW